MVIERIKDHGSTTYVHFSKDDSSKIKFDTDEDNAIQDTHVLKYNSKSEEGGISYNRCLL